MKRLPEQTGLSVEQIIPRIFAPEQGLPFLEDLEPLARSLGVNPDKLIEDGLPIQDFLVERKLFQS